MTYLKTLMAVACFLAAASTFADGTGVEIERDIHLKEAAEVWTQTVCLSDLALDGWLQGRCAVDRQFCCRWTMGGERTRVFTRAQISRELAGLKLGGLGLRVSGAERVLVSQTKRQLSEKEIGAKIGEALGARLKGAAGKIIVDQVRLSAPVFVALASETAWAVEFAEPIGESTPVKITESGPMGRPLGWAQVRARLDDDIYVARRTIRPTEAIRLEDFELRRANVLAGTGGGSGVLREGAFPVGMRARQSILSGTPLSQGQVENTPMVKLGDMVTLILRSDSLRVSTKGVVQGSAAIGDMVTVQLSRYNRTFRGRLVEGRLVEVWL